MYSINLYTGITTSKSSTLSIDTPLIFEMQLINGALFLKEISLIIFLVSLLFASLTATVLAAVLAVFICAALLQSGKVSSGKISSGKSSTT